MTTTATAAHRHKRKARAHPQSTPALPPTRLDPLATVSAPIAQAVEALAGLDLTGLRAAWRTRYGAPPPLRSVELLRLMLAWRLQAEALGGLDRESRRQLKRRGPLQPEGLALGVGTRLRREWQGRLVEVEIEASGFRWQGTLYPSLSAAASAIAGTRWNGPRFFGCASRASEAALRALYPQKLRGRARPGVQQPRRPAGSLRSLRQEPKERRLAQPCDAV